MDNTKVAQDIIKMINELNNDKMPANWRGEELLRENTDLRAKLDVNKISIKLLKELLHDAEQQINKMKNCQNCKYGNDFDAPDCQRDCEEYEKWEWEGMQDE